MHKHNFESFWIREENKTFIPKQGELVIYDAEVNENDEIIEDAYVTTGTIIGPNGNLPTNKRLPGGRDTAYKTPRIKVGDGIHPLNKLGFVGIDLEEVILCCGNSKNCD